MKTVLVRSMLVLGLLTSTHAFAWGQKGHKTVNRVAISMVSNPDAKKFLDANRDQIVSFASTPDTKWKDGPDAGKEKPMHWFEMDAYKSNRLGDGLTDVLLGRAQDELGQDYIQKYGLAMWRVSDFYIQLVDALKKGDFKRAVQIAGVMGHYVGDMTQPMHASSDYDGQSINKPGSHKYYETTLVDRMNDGHLDDRVTQVAGLRRSELERSVGNDLDNAKLQRLAWAESTEAFDNLKGVYDRFDQNSPDDEWLSKDVTPRIGRASALLGKIWDVAFATVEGGKLPDKSVGAKEPEWIPMLNQN